MSLERTEHRPSLEKLPKHHVVRAAHEKARKGHDGQMRRDGTTYLEGHCEQVYEIINTEWGITEDIDPELLADALMHDLLEDTDVTYEEIAMEFGTRIANVIRGVSKYKSEGSSSFNLPDIKSATIESQRIVLGTGYEDYRVLLVKLADRLQNFRTMEGMPEESRVRKARETLEIYAPVARALGMWKVKAELEDWSFQYLMPEKYREFKSRVDADPRRSNEAIAHAKSHLEIVLSENEIPAKIEVRKNGYWALYQKNERLERTAQGSLPDINDVVSFRVITDTRRRCYDALWAVHEHPFSGGKVVSGRFDEFIVEPRPNKYQAIQTTIEVNGYAIEVAIATSAMEEFNTDGILAKIRAGETNLDEYLMKSIFVQNGDSDPSKIRMKLLLRNATGIDLAYAMGENIGASATALIINDEEHSLAEILKNASIVKIKTDPDKKLPKREWMQYCLPETRATIDQQLRVFARNELVESRKTQLDSVLHKRGILELSDLGGIADSLLQDYSCHSVTELAFLVTRSNESLLEFEKTLDVMNITKEALGWTSIRLSGNHDSPGILRDVVDWTRELGCTIIKDESRVYPNGAFTINMIIKDVKPEDELLITQRLSNDSRFQEVILV